MLKKLGNTVQFILSLIMGLILSLAMVAIGATLIWYPQVGLRGAQLFFIGFLLMKSGGEFWAFFMEKELSTRMRLYQGIAFLLLALAVIYNHAFRLVTLSAVLSGILLVDASLKLFVSFLYRRAEVSWWWYDLLSGLVSLVISVVFINENNYVYVIQFSGLYIALQGLQQIIMRVFTGRHRRVSPTHRLMQFLFIHGKMYDNSFLPMKWFRRIETVVKENEDVTAFLKQADMKKTVPMDGYYTFKVNIHSWDDTVLTMKGHSDFSVNDICFSYGNYDAKTHYFGGSLSDGVLVVAEEEPYINYCLTEEKKVIVQYTLRLNQEQWDALSDLTEELQQVTEVWEPPVLTDFQATDAASLLYNAIQPQFYKFTSGKYRFYFVLNTNCINFIQYVLKRVGFLENVNDGVLTPGDYIDLFEKKLNNPNDYDIIERQIKIKV